MLHLVNDDEAFERLKRELGIREACLVGGIFEVEERDSTMLAGGQAAGQGRLAHLPGTHEPDYGKLAEEAAEACFVAGPRNHEQQGDTGKSKAQLLFFPLEAFRRLFCLFCRMCLPNGARGAKLQGDAR